MVGFCFGGWISNMMAVRLTDLGAAVPYYSRQPEAKDARKIKALLLLHYGELDTRLNTGWPAFEKKLKVNTIEQQTYVYSEVTHGFHNNTTPRYDKGTANLSRK
jgi:carboxymethylenebutenolidase